MGEPLDLALFFETPREVEVARWLQDNGAPQVIQMKTSVVKED